jgi:hypothetical protein
MFNTVTIGLSIALPTIANFRWDWDSNPCVPLMLHYLWKPHKHNLPMFSLRPKNPPDSSSRFNTYANRSRRFCRNPMLSTRSAMINTSYRTHFRLETSSCYTFIRTILQGPIRSYSHFTMGLTPSPRLWVTMILSSTLHHSLACTQCSMWTYLNHIFHHYLTPLRS